MLFNYRYHGNSQVESSASATDMRFTPDTLRDPAYFVATLGHHLPFREAISALHDVVISDLRYIPKERKEYKAWLKENEALLLAQFMAEKEEIGARIKTVQAELSNLRNQSAEMMAPFYKALKKYYRYLYLHDRDAWMVLDPVISVHPDEVSFECFSLDESSYGRLSCSLNIFKTIDTFACGTTNIDYSADLYNEFQKIRDYKETRLTIDPGGFEVSTSHEEDFIENKIDLPESWVRGFLQVSAAMNLPMTVLRLHPMDVHNFCFVLRRKKEKVGPRSMRFILTPDHPVRVVFEPWGIELSCPRSVYTGNISKEIRIWGRRRLHILERLIPVAEAFDLHLLGTGLPSFFIARMPGMTFTLGLSGWTANDWSRMGHFDLMAPRAQVDGASCFRVFKALKARWFATGDQLADELKLGQDVVLGALAQYTQAGRVIFDLDKGVFRLRELSRDPLPMEQLRYSNERESQADRFVKADLVTVEEQMIDDMLVLTGTVMDDAISYQPQVVIDKDQRLVDARCRCHFFIHNKLYKGPCAHMVALRMAHSRQTGRKQ